MLFGMIVTCIICGGIDCIQHCTSQCCEYISGCCAAVFTMREKVSREFHADEFAAAQREHQEKCASLQKQVDDEKKSQSTDGLVIMVLESSGKICKRHVSCFVLCRLPSCCFRALSPLTRAFSLSAYILLIRSSGRQTDFCCNPGKPLRQYGVQAAKCQQVLLCRN